MKEISILAFAKLNLFLEVLNEREDGLHEIISIMQNISLADELEIVKARNGYRLESEGEPIEVDNNLITSAHRLLEKRAGLKLPVRIKLIKRIPVSAGMGGGSADAAATLVALNGLFDIGLQTEHLLEIAFELGSDVPFFLFGGTALVEGAGERVRSIKGLPEEVSIVISNPDISLSTSTVFGFLDQQKDKRDKRSVSGIIPSLSIGKVEEVEKNLFNRFEELIISRVPEVAELKAAFFNAGSINPMLSGSGPTVFSIFSSRSEAQTAFHLLKIKYKHTYLVGPMRSSYRIANFS